MNTTRRGFLSTTAVLAGAVTATTGDGPLDAAAIARGHTIVRDLPTPGFFEGMLLGNGDIGVCVTVRPDALGLHIGKEDSWDLRVSEDHYRHVLNFKDFLDLWKRAGDEAKRRGLPPTTRLEREIDFVTAYMDKVRSSYAKPWPRPWPCGIVWIHWDPRFVTVARQELDPSNGLFTLTLNHDDPRRPRRAIRVRCFVNWTTGHISVSSEGGAPFRSVAYYPNIDAAAQLPAPELEGAAGSGYADFSCYQHFPATAPTEAQPDPPRRPQDRNFMLCGRLHGRWTREEGGPAPRVFFRGDETQPFRLDLTLFTPRDHADNVPHARREAARLSAEPVGEHLAATEAGWRAFWNRSAVRFEDAELERIWYHNQYFLACCLREGKVAPGLFGNWSSGRIGTAWHGDYHMNYNTQQVWWGVFSSNHVDQHLPYVELCENLWPMSKDYARTKFEMPGAFFPHSAYPVPSQTIPYPVPPWGYEVCETPWTVQSLWWHYLYTLDRDYLRRVYPILRDAARFLAAYVTKGSDGRFHIVPTVSPENWGMTPDFHLNRDCIIDLALTEFVFDAVVEASKILETDAAERAQWADIRGNLASYPTAKSEFGEIWTDVTDGPGSYVYNVPCTLAPVFPGEQVGIGLRPEQHEIARRTIEYVRLEGGNDLVYQPLCRARMGMLDIDWFKKEVRYCRMPNGAAGDRVRQIDGRYRDTTDYDFMMRMGVWIENLSLPAVLNECLLQSYSGVIRLFPNRQGLGPARFQDLRAAGAFLVTAAWDGRRCGPILLWSEQGAEARVENPWNRAIRVVTADQYEAVAAREEGGILRFPTRAGGRYRIEPA